MGTKIITIEDAETYIENSVLDWEWGEYTSLEGCIEFAYRNFSYIGDDNLPEILKAYIEFAGEDPADYSL